MTNTGRHKTKDECIEDLDTQVARLHDVIRDRDRLIAGLKEELAAAATKLVILDDYREQHITEVLALSRRGGTPGERI